MVSNQQQTETIVVDTNQQQQLQLKHTSVYSVAKGEKMWFAKAP